MNLTVFNFPVPIYKSKIVILLHIVIVNFLNYVTIFRNGYIDQPFEKQL